MPIASKFTAGDPVVWNDVSFVLPDGVTVATPATHDLTTSLRGPIATAGVDLTGAVVNGWATTLPADKSAALNVGNSPLIWFWQAVVVAHASGNARTTVGGGQFTVLPNLASVQIGTDTYDGRTQNERDLAAVTAEISARISGGATLEYTIGSRSLKKEPMAALVTIQTRLKSLVAREKTAQAIANGQGNPGRVLARFTRR